MSGKPYYLAVDNFIEMETDEAILYSASIYIHKP
jgi:hypothetical protein